MRVTEPRGRCRSFAIPRNGPWFVGVERRLTAPTVTSEKDRDVIRQQVEFTVQGAHSRLALASHLAYWEQFCTIYGAQSGSMLSTTQYPTDTGAVDAENKLIFSFLAYVVRFPRTGKQSNTAKYAEQVLAKGRSYFEDKSLRQPGLGAYGRALGRIKLMQKGLRRIAPQASIHLLPVLQHHPVKDRLDLSRNATYCALRALGNTQFQGVLRGRWWDPPLDTYLGRLSSVMARDKCGRRLYAAFKLELLPSKNDPSGERHLTRTFVIDTH